MNAFDDHEALTFGPLTEGVKFDAGKARMDLLTVGCLIFFLCVMLAGSISSLQYAIQTGERRFYGCFAFRKGVIPPDA